MFNAMLRYLAATVLILNNLVGAKGLARNAADADRAVVEILGIDAISGTQTFVAGLLPFRN